MTLFELDNAELDLLAAIEAAYDAAAESPGEEMYPDLEAQVRIDAHLEQLAEVQEQIGPKLAGYVRAIRAKRAKADLLEAERDLYLAEAERLRRRMEDERDTADLLEERLKAFLERRGLTEIEAGTFRLKIVNQGGKLPLCFAPGIEPADAPPEWRRVIPQTFAWNRETIEAHLKAGQPVTATVMDEHGEARTVPLAWHGSRPTKLKIK